MVLPSSLLLSGRLSRASTLPLSYILSLAFPLSTVPLKVWRLQVTLISEVVELVRTGDQHTGRMATDLTYLLINPTLVHMD